MPSHTITNRACFTAHCRYVIKELVQAFSCAHIKLWMYLGRLVSTQEARDALGCASNNSCTSLVLSKLPGARYTHAKHEPKFFNSLRTNNMIFKDWITIPCQTDIQQHYLYQRGQQGHPRKHHHLS